MMIPSTFNQTAQTLSDIQWGNLVLSSLSGILIHVYIAFSVLKRRLLHDKYMLLTYMRSYIDIIYLITTLYIQEVGKLFAGVAVNWVIGMNKVDFHDQSDQKMII